MAVDRHAAHRIPLHPPKRAAAYPTTTGIRHLAQVLTEPAFVTPNINGFNRPTNLRFGPDGCAYVVDYGAVRDAGADSHVVGTGNGSLVQIPGTGVIWKICPM